MNISNSKITYITTGKRSGNTAQIVLYSSIFGLPIICYTQTQIDRCKDVAKMLDLEIPEPKMIKWRYKN